MSLTGLSQVESREHVTPEEANVIVKMKLITIVMTQMAERGVLTTVYWLRLRASTAGGAGSIPGQGINAARPGIKKKKEKEINGCCQG